MRKLTRKHIIIAVAILIMLLLARKLLFGTFGLLLSIAIWVVPIVLIFKFRRGIWFIIKIILYVLMFIGILALAFWVLGLTELTTTAAIFGGIALLVGGYMFLKFFRDYL